MTQLVTEKRHFWHNGIHIKKQILRRCQWGLWPLWRAGAQKPTYRSKFSPARQPLVINSSDNARPLEPNWIHLLKENKLFVYSICIINKSSGLNTALAAFLDQKEISKEKKDVASNKRSQVKRNVPLWVTGGNAVLCKSYAGEMAEIWDPRTLNPSKKFQPTQFDAMVPPWRIQLGDFHVKTFYYSFLSQLKIGETPFVILLKYRWFTMC